MWRDAFISVRKEMQSEIKKILGSEFKEHISDKKERMFEFLSSDNEDEFIFGCTMATYWYEDLLNEQEKERIKNIVLKKRRLFRKPKENLGYHFIEINLWLELCDMLEIEPSETEMEIYLSQRSLSSQDMEEIKRYHIRVSKAFQGGS